MKHIVRGYVTLPNQSLAEVIPRAKDISREYLDIFLFQGYIRGSNLFEKMPGLLVNGLTDLESGEILRALNPYHKQNPNNFPKGYTFDISSATSLEADHILPMDIENFNYACFRVPIITGDELEKIQEHQDLYDGIRAVEPGFLAVELSGDYLEQRLKDAREELFLKGFDTLDTQETHLFAPKRILK